MRSLRWLGALLALSVLGSGCGPRASSETGVGVSSSAGTESGSTSAAELAQGQDPHSHPPASEPPPVPPTRLISIPGGITRPLYPGKDEPAEATVAAFLIEAHPVTNAQFLRFLWEQPHWRRSQVKRLFADKNYLQHWEGDLEYPEGAGAAPITNVSWFAARAYAEWAGLRLPTLREWEYVAQASSTEAFGRDDPEYQQTILNWYAQPSPAVPAHVEQRDPNFFGVHDMHGLVWEWVDDFNSALVTGESRGDSGLERNLFCGSGSIGSADPKDYAAFMRFAFRSSLEGNYTVQNLGFRCAQTLAEE